MGHRAAGLLGAPWEAVKMSALVAALGLAWCIAIARSRLADRYSDAFLLQTASGSSSCNHSGCSRSNPTLSTQHLCNRGSSIDRIPLYGLVTATVDRSTSATRSAARWVHVHLS